VFAVNALVVWSLLAVGAVYTWGIVPVVIASGALALWRRPRFGGTPAARWLDGALLTLLVAAGCQLLPLPRPLLSVLSPGVADFETRHTLGGPDTGLRALALDPSLTAYTLMVVAGIVLLFWTCRSLFEGGGVRTVVRTLGYLGLVVSLLAIVQRAVAPSLIYGLWPPLQPGAAPIGPVVNQNQFAGWLLMALPLTVGYLVAHVEAYRPSRPQPWRTRLRRRLHARTLVLAAGGVLMALAVLVSRSRSATVGLVVAVGVGWIVGGWRQRQRGRWVVVIVALLFGAAALAWIDLGSLADRFNHVDSGMAGRMTIWRDTLSVARRFWLTGVGLGGYEAAMAVYQTSTRGVLYNHAHSQYLQMATEGGLLLAVPAFVALAALVVGARARLEADRSPMWSIRVGAAAGLAAVAVQSVWESVLRMPANGVLMAVAAAILLHRAPETPRE